MPDVVTTDDILIKKRGNKAVLCLTVKVMLLIMRAVMSYTSRSSRGLGHRPFTAVTGVRLPYGTPFLYVARFLASAGIAQLVERYLAKVQVAGSNPVSRSNKKAQNLSFVLFFVKIFPLPSQQPSYGQIHGPASDVHRDIRPE